MSWEVELRADVDHWFGELCRTDPRTADLVEQAVDLLADIGPTVRLRPATTSEQRYAEHVATLYEEER